MMKAEALKEQVMAFFKQRFCRHVFVLVDLKATGIPEPKKPEGNDLGQWNKYLKALYTGDSFKKRVQWPCSKCGRVFYAHCGLDIAAEHIKKK